MYHARTNGNVVTVAQAQNGDVVYMKWVSVNVVIWLPRTIWRSCKREPG